MIPIAGTKARACALASLLAFIGAGSALAQDVAAEARDDEAVTVWGIRSAQIGKAFSASEGEIDFGRFVNRPLLRVGELAEVVPGLAATQHSGTGKANQYFLRGFNLDHGTDFSVSLDGMPINLRTHAHGHGYLDLNFLIPEAVEHITYRKGPYSAEVGDFSAAGSAAFRTFDLLPESFLQAELGENNWRRALVGQNFGQYGYAIVDLTGDDGPWDRDENLRKYNGFARFHFGDFALAGGYYHAAWDSSDQIPQRAVEAGLLSDLGNVDPTVGGKTQRFFLNGTYDDGDGLTGNAYVQNYKLNLWSNFTYFLDDPVDGDQFEQAEHRTIWGGQITKAFGAFGGSNWTPRIGVELRYDDIGKVGLYHTRARERLDTVREDAVEQLSGALWADVSGEFDAFRIDLGLRADAMHVDVKSSNPANSGDESDFLLSPKASLAYRLSDELEAYASYGRGFHSNDARGGTITIDPASGDPVDPVQLLVRSTGAEFGLRYETRGFAASAALWYLDLDSELVYVGDAGATEPSDASERYGVELLSTWKPVDWLTLDASYAYTDARFKDVPREVDRIPLAVTYVLTGGATVQVTDGLTAALTLRRIGHAPLIEDGSVESDPSTVVNGRIAYQFDNVTLAVEGLNLFDSDDSDITYFYASRLPGEPDEGIEDIHFHPIPPRSFRLQLRVAY